MNKLNLLFTLSALGGACFHECDAQFTRSSYDLTLVGQIKYSGSLDRLPISLAGLLSDELRINHIPTPGSYDFTDVPEKVANILKNEDKAPGNVGLIFEELWNGFSTQMPCSFVPENCHIKIAYSLLESTAVPALWVEILNTKFDLVVVADEFYRSVYEKSGVKIPIYVLPHGVELEALLKEPVRQKPGHPFTFGCVGALWRRKNQALLIDAFHAEFGKDPNVKLMLHSRLDHHEYKNIIEEKLNNYANPSIELSYRTLSADEFKDFFKTLDCYVIVSKGEGFSITPREALALAKPCILSDNTAHKTICSTGYVYGVPSNITQPIDGFNLGSMGVSFDCKQEDVQKALREVYEHYEEYAARALEGRKWVESYCWKNLKFKFLNLIKPKRVIMGPENLITDDYLMTNSETLYKKYVDIMPKHTAEGLANNGDTASSTETELEAQYIFRSHRIPVDFETSMGKGDAYFDKYYNQMIQDIHNWSSYITPHSSTEMLNLCQRTYDKYKSLSFPIDRKIPRIIHQIWVGKKPFPEKYRNWQKTWQNVPGWSYKLWTDEDVEKLNFANKERYYKEKNMGGRADILRIEVLNQYGGLYADTDFELLNPEALEEITESLDFFAGLTPLDCRTLIINNALIGSVPHHPILEACVQNLEKWYVENEIVLNGPGFFSKMILQHADKGLRDVIFPPTFVYPLGNQQMDQSPYDLMPNNAAKLEKVKLETIKPETFATHWWESSWELPDAWQ